MRNPGFQNIRHLICPSHSWYQNAPDWGKGTYPKLSATAWLRVSVHAPDECVHGQRQPRGHFAYGDPGQRIGTRLSS